MEKGLRVKDRMAKEVATLRANDKLSIADDVMSLGRIRHLPVLDDDDDAIVGIVSQRDLFRGALARALGYGEFARQKLLGTLLVKDVMSQPVATIDEESPLRDAARRMMERKIGCLVVTRGGRLAGILTESDFVRAAAEEGTPL